MSGFTLPTGAELVERMRSNDPGSPPLLPASWEAQVLLTPYGDADSPLENYKQLVIANVACDADAGAMMVDLYLTQDLTVFRLLFVNGTGWYWLEGTPGQPDWSFQGPFATTLQVPATDFLAQARYGNSWAITGKQCDHWVLPAPPDPQIPAHGSWYSFREDNGALFRVFTFDSRNTGLLPILGSYYFAHIPTFTSLGQSPAALSAVLDAVRNGTPATSPAAFSNPLVTQNDIQSVMADPLSAPSSCTVQDLQTLIPGFLPAPTGVTLPEWTDQTFILGMTIGTDFIPYYTVVFYWYSHGHQQSIFVGLGPDPGKSTYYDRQDCCLTTSYTDLPQYYAKDGVWTAACCYPRLDGIALPVRDWVKAAIDAFGGGVAASITGNPQFGLAPGEVLHLIDCELPRGGGVTSLFWVWFTEDQAGVLFSESNYAESVTAHNLQLIDYLEFEQNASWITPDRFNDPCGTVGPCPLPVTPPASWVKGPRSIVSKPEAGTKNDA
ncbi:MAG: hypothetical protein LJF06_16670 [Gemmatimonadetes bacterium]|nr:hypothetical protein [Gemmatimonadota bacterium]